ncbi:YciI family protein [Emcibacter nanhaiensis]|uniref:YciI family protein n=1 Tax=Emcibacter nanhaiensis TaxID=1505037 RepID=A0A501PNV0_9PROT|nr:YciI family protein [Emcibacter nanhaiensis]TPD61466.1 YciI family protein [Emcibacter nanhaiensis]
MHFVILAYDKADSLDLRMSVRPDHLDYAEKSGVVKLAGPILTEEDEPKPCGSMIVVEVHNTAAAENFAANDPYAKAGLFDKVRILPFNPVLGTWLEK